MKNFLHLSSLIHFGIYIFILFPLMFVFGQYSRTKYEYKKEKFDGQFDCILSSPCQIPFRMDYKEYLDLKYNHKRKLAYQMDNGGYYYFGYNPATKANVSAFNLKIRVHFTKITSGNKIAEIGIDTETQSGQINVTSAGAEKPNWKYLLPETPTLSPVIVGEQILVSADHPVEGGKLYCLNAKTGKLEWFFLTPGAILAYPLIFERNVIIIDDSGNIYWVDRETGNMKFKFTMEEFPVPNPVLKDKILYLAGQRGHLYAINLEDSRLVWKDLALMGDVWEMLPNNKGFVLYGGNKHWLFNYSNGYKQDTIPSGIFP